MNTNYFNIGGANIPPTGIDLGYKHAPIEIEPSLPKDTKNTEPAPKYDPCRKFRKGDKARIVEYKGRYYDVDTARHAHDIVTVNVNEAEIELEDLISVSYDGDFFYTDAAYLELVTPVEELEPYTISEGAGIIEVYNEKLEVVTPVEELGPYCVGESTDYFCVEDSDGNEISCYWKDSHPTPQAAAEAERDRMNALRNKKHLLTINTMNNEQQTHDDRFAVVELENGGFAVCDKEAPENRKEACIFRPGVHPYAKKAAEAARDQLEAMFREEITIRLIDELKPQREKHVSGTFSKAQPLTLTVEEKRRYLAEIFRSPDFSASDKFKALQEDNRMLVMSRLKNRKELE